jgi:hypothetical protein
MIGGGLFGLLFALLFWVLVKALIVALASVRRCKNQRAPLPCTNRRGRHRALGIDKSMSIDHVENGAAYSTVVPRRRVLRSSSKMLQISLICVMRWGTLRAYSYFSSGIGPP